MISLRNSRTSSVLHYLAYPWTETRRNHLQSELKVREKHSAGQLDRHKPMLCYFPKGDEEWEVVGVLRTCGQLAALLLESPRLERGSSPSQIDLTLSGSAQIRIGIVVRKSLVVSVSGVAFEIPNTLEECGYQGRMIQTLRPQILLPRVLFYKLEYKGCP